ATRQRGVIGGTIPGGNAAEVRRPASWRAAWKPLNTKKSASAWKATAAQSCTQTSSRASSTSSTMPTMKLHSAPFRDISPSPTKMAAITTSTISATTSPIVPVMISLPNASENCVAPRPRKKAQLLPATKRTEFTSDKPAIQMNQLAPDLTSCACFAVSLTAGCGPGGLGGGVLGGPDVLTKTPRGRSLWGETLAQNRAASKRSDEFEHSPEFVELILPAHDGHLRPVLIV